MTTEVERFLNGRPFCKQYKNDSVDTVPFMMDTFIYPAQCDCGPGLRV